MTSLTQSSNTKKGLDIKSAIPPSPIKSKAEIKEAIQKDPIIQAAKERLSKIQKNNVENKFKTPKSIPPPSTPASSLAPSPSVTNSPASQIEIVINLVQDKIDEDHKKNKSSYTANMKSDTLAEFQRLAKGLDIDWTNIKNRKQLEDALDTINKKFLF